MLSHFRTMQFTCALYVDTTISTRIAIGKVFLPIPCVYSTSFAPISPGNSLILVKSNQQCVNYLRDLLQVCATEIERKERPAIGGIRTHELFIHTALQLCYYRYLWQIRVNYILAKLLKVTNNSMALKMAPSLKQAWGMVDIQLQKTIWIIIIFLLSYLTCK